MLTFEGKFNTLLIYFCVLTDTNFQEYFCQLFMFAKKSGKIPKFQYFKGYN